MILSLFFIIVDLTCIKIVKGVNKENIEKLGVKSGFFILRCFKHVLRVRLFNGVLIWVSMVKRI